MIPHYGLQPVGEGFPSGLHPIDSGFGFFGTPVSAEITQTGTILDFPISSLAATGTVSSTITVPADAQIIIVGLASANGFTNAHTGMTFTKGGVDTAMVKIVGTDIGGSWQGFIFYQVLPDTGTNKTLKWNWTQNSDRQMAISITFWKGIDTASAVRDSDSANTQGGGAPLNTPTLTAQSGDKIVAFASFFHGAADGGGNVSAWNNLTELAEITHADVSEGAWATGDPTGNTTVGVATCSDSYINLMALVLKKPGAIVRDAQDGADA